MSLGGVAAVQARIQPACGQQAGVRAFFDDAAAFHNDDAVGVLDGGT